MFKKSIINLALVSALMPSYVLVAAENVTSEIVDEQTETIVVIGKKPRNVQDVVGAVSVIDSAEIDRQLAHDISDIVRYEAGVNVVKSGNRFGDTSIAIRGISGNRIATEIDGIPVAEQFSIGSYSNSGRNHIDPDLIKQVEILRGPASSTYGSDAIGGVVSFITKKPADLLAQTDKDIYLGLKTAYHSVDDSNSVSLNSAFAFGKSSFLLSGAVREGHEVDRNMNSDLTADKQDNESNSILVKYFYEISDNQELSLSYDYANQESQTDIRTILGLGRFRSTTALYGDDETERENIALGYDFVLDSDWLEGGYIRLYTQTTETTQLTDEARTSRGVDSIYDRDFYYKQEIDGARFNFYTNVLTGSVNQQIGYGLEYSSTTVTELRNGLQTNVATGESTNIILTEDFPLRDFPISEIDEFGVYINSEITFADSAFTFIPALRYDNYELTPKEDSIYLEDNPTTSVVDISEDSVSPKFSVLYQVNEQSKVYVQYVKGFRAPPFEDANIGLDIPMFGMRAIPNPDLKSESTDGYEIGYNYTNDTHQIDLVAFYNDYDDFIQTKVNLGFDPTVGRLIFQSQNIDNTEIYGFEMGYKGNYQSLISSNDTINTYANLFWSEGENKDTGEPLNELEPNHAVLGIQWMDGNENISIALNANIVEGKTDLDDPDDVLATTSGYATFDLITNYYINDSITISGAIFNLTDREYANWSEVNGFEADDPLVATLAAPGVNGSVQLKYIW